MAIDTKNSAAGVESNWIPLCKAGPAGDREITKDDLDSIIGNFKKVPVVFGRPSKNGPVVAQLDAVKRDGDTLHAKLSGVDPRIKRLMDGGMLKKKVMQIQGHGMPEGPSITGVGLVQRQHGAHGVWTECPETEAGLNALCGNSGKLTAEADLSAPGTQVSFAEEVRPKKLIDVNGNSLTALAKERAKQESISFGEALTQVAIEQPELTVSRMDFREQTTSHPTFRKAYDRNGERLSTLAKERAKQESISFGEALSQVANERPELTVPDIEFREVEVRR
jgi:hypothetical protein